MPTTGKPAAHRYLRSLALVTALLSLAIAVRILLYGNHARHTLELLALYDAGTWAKGHMALRDADGNALLDTYYIDEGRQSSSTGPRDRLPLPAHVYVEVRDDSLGTQFSGVVPLDPTRLRAAIDRHQDLVRRYPQLQGYETDVHSFVIIAGPRGRVEVRLRTSFELDEVLAVAWLPVRPPAAAANLPPRDTSITGLYRYSIRWADAQPPPATVRLRTSDGGGSVLGFSDSLTAHLLAGAPVLYYGDDDPATNRPRHTGRHAPKVWAERFQASRVPIMLRMRYKGEDELGLEVD